MGSDAGDRQVVTVVDHATDRKAELPVHVPTLGPRMVDIRSLYQQLGVFAFDPGATATGAAESRITYVDGESGKLLYRGYPLEALVENCDYSEVCHLLLHGELPNRAQKRAFDYEIASHAEVHERTEAFVRCFPQTAHPMAILSSVLAAISGFEPVGRGRLDPDHRRAASRRLIAQVPVLAAMAHRHTTGQRFVRWRAELSYAENFLRMILLPPEADRCGPVLVRALEVLLIAQADHEQNASTSTVRAVGSTHAPLHACIAAGVASLWGPRHGGANEAVLRMLEEIGSIDRIPAFLTRAKDKADPFRLMGFGNRLYRNYDPRAKVVRAACLHLLDAIGQRDDPLLALAMELERTARADSYFVERKLYPNVDFYSGLTMRALGIPVEMFTAIFAVARAVGWVAHWNELVQDPRTKIQRPRQLYLGPEERQFVAIDRRPGA